MNNTQTFTREEGKVGREEAIFVKSAKILNGGLKRKGGGKGRTLRFFRAV